MVNAPGMEFTNIGDRFVFDQVLIPITKLCEQCTENRWNSAFGVNSASSSKHYESATSMGTPTVLRVLPKMDRY